MGDKKKTKKGKRANPQFDETLDPEAEAEIQEAKQAFYGTDKEKPQPPRSVAGEMIPETEIKNTPPVPDAELIVDAKDATIQVLETTIAALERSNETITRRTKWLWEIPKVVLSVALGAGAMIVAANMYTQYLNTAELARVAGTMRDETGKSEKLREDIEKRQRELKTETDKLRTDLGNIQSQYTAANNALTDSRGRGIKAARSAHKALSFVYLGSQQLSRRSLGHALTYAKKAETELLGAAESLKMEPELVQTLQDIKPSVWILRGEIGIQGEDVSAILQAGDNLLKNESTFIEGNHFRGIGKLHAAIDEVIDDVARKQLRDIAIESLSKVVETDSRANPDSILLAAANYDAGQYRPAVKNANAYLDTFPQSVEERKQLSRQDQAYIVVASILKSGAEFLLHDRQDPQIPVSCDVAIGDIAALEARIYECVLDQPRKRRNEIRLDDKQFETYEAFRSRAAQILRNAAPSCCAPASKTDAAPSGDAPASPAEEKPPPPKA